MECKCLPGCPFFNDRMASMPSTANIMKKKYCQGDFESCARFMVFSKLGKPAVPSDLFPNEVDKAKKIIS